MTGTDIAALDGDGRLVKVVGFFGELDSAAVMRQRVLPVWPRL